MPQTNAAVAIRTVERASSTARARRGSQRLPCSVPTQAAAGGSPVLLAPIPEQCPPPGLACRLSARRGVALPPDTATKGWTVSQLPSRPPGWTVFHLPSTPWAAIGRPIHYGRPGYIDSVTLAKGTGLFSPRGSSSRFDPAARPLAELRRAPKPWLHERQAGVLSNCKQGKTV